MICCVPLYILIRKRSRAGGHKRCCLVRTRKEWQTEDCEKARYANNCKGEGEEDVEVEGGKLKLEMKLKLKLKRIEGLGCCSVTKVTKLAALRIFATSSSSLLIHQP